VSHPKLFLHFVGLALFLAMMVAASPAWAWGDLGHKIICEIALQELNDKARNEVTRLIALDATFDSFPDACTWPDHPRKRAEEHFINVARSVHTITTATCPTAPKCLFTAIPADLEVLRTSNDDQAKLASLKFLGHWVGDIHCGSGFWGGQRPSLADYVAGRRPPGRRPPPQRANVDYPLFVQKGFRFFTMPWAPWAQAGIKNALAGIKR